MPLGTWQQIVFIDFDNRGRHRDVDLTTVKELLGHKDIKMTLRYAHLAPSHKVKAVDVLDNTLNGKTAKSENCYNFATVGISG